MSGTDKGEYALPPDELLRHARLLVEHAENAVNDAELAAEQASATLRDTRWALSEAQLVLAWLERITPQNGGGAGHDA